MKWTILSLLFSFIFFISIAQAATEYLYTDNTENLDDTFIDERSVTQNWGSSQGISVGENSNQRLWLYIKFNVSNSTLDGSLVTDASYCFYIYNTGYALGEIPTVYTYLVYNQTWIEENVSWNTQVGGAHELINTTTLGNVTAAGYRCFNVTDGVQTAIDNSWSNVTFMTNTSLEYGSNDFYTLYSKECLGCGSPANQPYLSITFTASAPVITIDDPKNKTYGSSAMDFNITLNKAGSACNISLDGGSNKTMTAHSTTEYGYYNASMTDMTHTAVFSCNGTTGIIGTSSITFTVDTTKPQITIVLPLDETYENNSIEINITGSETLNWSLVQILNTNHTLVDDSGQWEYYNGSLDDGTYTLTFWFNDTAGNINSTKRTLVIDTQPPDYSALNPSSTSRAGGDFTTHTFECNWTQEWYPTTTVYLELDNINHTASNVAGDLYRKTFVGLNLGDHSFKWWGIDSADNINVTPTYTYTVTSIEENPGSPGTGGGGGVTVIIGGSCDFSTYPSRGLSGSGQPGQPIPPFRVLVYNQNVTQSFYANLVGEVSNYCEIEYRMALDIAPNGRDEFIINCIAPENGSITGNLIITSSLDCEYGLPMTISESFAFLTSLSNALKLLVSGDFMGFAMTEVGGVPIYIWLVITLVMVIAGIILL